MSMVQEIITLNINIDDTKKYHYVSMSNEYQNYTRQKTEAQQTLQSALDKTIPKAIDETVKQVVKSNPNMTWKD